MAKGKPWRDEKEMAQAPYKKKKEGFLSEIFDFDF